MLQLPAGVGRSCSSEIGRAHMPMSNAARTFGRGIYPG